MGIKVVQLVKLIVIELKMLHYTQKHFPSSFKNCMHARICVKCAFVCATELGQIRQHFGPVGRVKGSDVVGSPLGQKPSRFVGFGHAPLGCPGLMPVPSGLAALAIAAMPGSAWTNC